MSSLGMLSHYFSDYFHLGKHSVDPLDAPLSWRCLLKSQVVVHRKMIHVNVCGEKVQNVGTEGYHKGQHNFYFHYKYLKCHNGMQKAVDGFSVTVG